MNWKKNLLQMAILIGLSTLICGCGGQTYTLGGATNSLGQPTSNTSTSFPVVNPISQSTTGPSPVTYNKTAFNLTGYSGTKTIPSISTDNILKIAFTANPEGIIPNYNQYVLEFDCLQLTVSLLDSKNNVFGTTTVLVNALTSDGTGACVGSGQQANPTVDFSSYLASGHGPVSIQISDPMTDMCGPIYKYSVYQSCCNAVTTSTGQTGCEPVYEEYESALYSTYQITAYYKLTTNGSTQ